MLVECVKNLSDFVEPINKEGRWILVGVLHSGYDIIKTLVCRELDQKKWRAFCHVNGLGRPPVIAIHNAEVARHEKDAPQANIELV
jgi:hypothetical protein